MTCLNCPACDTPLLPEFTNHGNKPAYYYCSNEVVTGIAPHYKLFMSMTDSMPIIKFEVFLFKELGSVTKFFEDEILYKIGVKYYTYVKVSDDMPTHIGRSVTRTFKPEEFHLDPKNLKLIEDKLKYFIEMAEVFQ